MAKFTTSLKMIILLSMSVLVAVLGLGPQTAEARLSACRTDPVIWLSDGSKITIAADIETYQSDLREIVYTLHGPRGTNVTKVVFTGQGKKFKETVVFMDDTEAAQYQTDTLVSTHSAAVDVTVDSKLSIQDVKDSSVLVSVPGKSNAHVIADLQRR